MPAAPVGLEGLVRPFGASVSFAGYNRAQQRDANGNLVAPSSFSENSEEAAQPQLRWGATASTTTLTLAAQGFDYNLVTEDTETLLEVIRETETQRVTNPDDPTQFVDVANTKAITFSDDKNNSFGYKFKDVSSTPSGSGT